MCDKLWTGERLETFIYNDTTVEHLHRYAIALDLVKDKVVLDIASGEGYGSNLLCKYAKKVYGVDIDETIIKKAQEKYSCEKIEFKIGRADAIPLDNNSVDIVVSFETLEHHNKHHEMLKEIKRVLKDEGILIISTPDKRYYSDERNYKNPFHIKELYLNEFELLIGSHFKNSLFFGQNIVGGSMVIPIKEVNNLKSFNGDYSSIEAKNFNPMYIISIASDIDLIEYNKMSYFTGQTINNKNIEEVLKKIKKEVREDTVKWIKSSRSYRLGNILLRPFRLF